MLTLLNLDRLLVGDDAVVAVVGQYVCEGPTLLFGPAGVDVVKMLRFKGGAILNWEKIDNKVTDTPFSDKATLEEIGSVFCCM